MNRSVAVALMTLFAASGCASNLDQLESSVSVAQHPAGPLRIVVADFEDVQGEENHDGFTRHRPIENCGKQMADAISTRLLEFPQYRVIERSRLETVIKELELQRLDLMDADSVKKLGKLLSADGIVVGRAESWFANNVFGWQSRLKTTFRLVDVETGDVLWSIEGHVVRGNSSVDLYSLLADEVVPKLRAKLDAQTGGDGDGDGDEELGE